MGRCSPSMTSEKGRGIGQRRFEEGVSPVTIFTRDGGGGPMLVQGGVGEEGKGLRSSARGGNWRGKKQDGGLRGYEFRPFLNRRNEKVREVKGEKTGGGTWRVCKKPAEKKRRRKIAAPMNGQN